jgi:hypothetical protein
MTRCDFCEQMVPDEDITPIGADDSQGIDDSEWGACSTCLVDGIASGDVDVNPNALLPRDTEGEEWKDSER